MKLFSILDVKTGIFMRPFPEAATASAIRGFELAVNKGGENLISQYPDDFALMELGHFDDQTGKIEVHQAPVNIATGRSLVRRPGAVESANL